MQPYYLRDFLCRFVDYIKWLFSQFPVDCFLANFSCPVGNRGVFTWLAHSLLQLILLSTWSSLNTLQETDDTIILHVQINLMDILSLMMISKGNARYCGRISRKYRGTFSVWWLFKDDACRVLLKWNVGSMGHAGWSSYFMQGDWILNSLLWHGEFEWLK
jgi:hypothetical protein